MDTQTRPLNGLRSGILLNNEKKINICVTLSGVMKWVLESLSSQKMTNEKGL